MSYSGTPFVASKTLQQIREEIERDRRKLEERDRALTILERSERERVQTEPQQKALPTVDQPQGFTNAVRNSVVFFAGAEFTVPEIESYLKNINYPLPKDPRSRIAMVMQAMAKRGEIELTLKGSGRTPHRYRLAK